MLYLFIRTFLIQNGGIIGMKNILKSSRKLFTNTKRNNKIIKVTSFFIKEQKYKEIKKKMNKKSEYFTERELKKLS